MMMMMMLLYILRACSFGWCSAQSSVSCYHRVDKWIYWLPNADSRSSSSSDGVDT